MEAQRHDEELLAKKVALEEDQMRLLITRLKELEVHATSCVPVHLANEEVPKLVIPSFRSRVSSQSTMKISRLDISSFRGHSPTEEIEKPLQESLSEHKQSSHLISPHIQPCQEPLNIQNT